MFQPCTSLAYLPSERRIRTARGRAAHLYSPAAPNVTHQFTLVRSDHALDYYSTITILAVLLSSFAAVFICPRHYVPVDSPRHHPLALSWSPDGHSVVANCWTSQSAPCPRSHTANHAHVNPAPASFPRPQLRLKCRSSSPTLPARPSPSAVKARFAGCRPLPGNEPRS